MTAIDDTLRHLERAQQLAAEIGYEVNRPKMGREAVMFTIGILVGASIGFCAGLGWAMVTG